MTPQDFEPLLARLKSKRVVFVNTASASGPFVEALSGPGRVMVAATRTGGEMFATLFGGPVRRGVLDRGGRRGSRRQDSILEAFEYAKKSVAASYQREGLLPTEHSILDDNGDKEGSMEPGREAKDGQSAAVLAIGSLRQQALPADEKTRALYAERSQIERRIESLKLLKSGMDPAKYAVGTREARDRTGAEDAADSRGGREGQMKTALMGAGARHRDRGRCQRCRVVDARSVRGPGRQPALRAAAGHVGSPGEHALRRPLRVHPPALQLRLRRLPQPRRSALVARLSARRSALHQDPQRDHLHASAPGRIEHPVARRSGAVQLPGRLHGRAGLLVDDRQGMRELPRLPEKGRLRHFRRLPRARRGVGQPAGADAARAARRALDRNRRRPPPGVAFVLRDPRPEARWRRRRFTTSRWC